jgi:protein phosphatase PTC7
LNKKKNFRIVGSSTVCILSFDHASGILTTANLGDSGYIIVRNGKVIDRSERQTHTFNIPKVNKEIFR